jgi:hypothetical protein
VCGPGGLYAECDRYADFGPALACFDLCDAQLCLVPCDAPETCDADTRMGDDPYCTTEIDVGFGACLPRGATDSQCLEDLQCTSDTCEGGRCD